MKTLIVNNTKADIWFFHSALIDAAKAGAALPEEIADIFTYRTLTENGVFKIIVEFA